MGCLIRRQGFILVSSTVSQQWCNTEVTDVQSCGQITTTSLSTLSIITGRMVFLPPNRRSQSTVEGT